MKERGKKGFNNLTEANKYFKKLEAKGKNVNMTSFGPAWKKKKNYYVSYVK